MTQRVLFDTNLSKYHLDEIEMNNDDKTSSQVYIKHLFNEVDIEFYAIMIILTYNDNIEVSQ